jgi:hypothetical protein
LLNYNSLQYYIPKGSNLQKNSSWSLKVSDNGALHHVKLFFWTYKGISLTETLQFGSDSGSSPDFLAKLEGFNPWCYLVSKLSKYYNIIMFWKLYSTCHWVKRESPTNNFFCPPFLSDDGSKIQVPKCNLILSRWWTKSK